MNFYELSESFFDYAKNHQGGNVEVFKNPDRRELRELSQEKSIRAILTQSDCFAWDAFGGLHFTIRNYFKGMFLDSMSVILYPEGNGVHVFVTDNNKNTQWHHNSQAAELVRSHPYLNKMWSDIEISYWDEDIVGDWEQIAA